MLCLFTNCHFSPELSVQCSSSFSVVWDLCPELGKSPHCRWQSSAGDELGLVAGLHFFVFSLRIFQNHMNMIGVLLFGVFCCCFIHLSLPLYKLGWLLSEFLKLFLDGFTQRCTARLTLLSYSGAFFFLVPLGANFNPNVSARALNF